MKIVRLESRRRPWGGIVMRARKAWGGGRKAQKSSESRQSSKTVTVEKTASQRKDKSIDKKWKREGQVETACAHVSIERLTFKQISHA